ncbi:MAG: hypothetical protein KDH96_04125 [Candidatus Riesia sp.]|nr:hypothetical protein [Candidatus Riesia sp.]
MNGTTPVISTKSVEADSHVYFEVINDTGLGSSAVLTPADQNIFITRGTPLGFIDKGFCTDSLHQLATDSVVDSTSSTTSRLTIPSSGVEAFGEAFSVDTAVPIVGGLDLLAGEFIGLWYEKTAPEGMPAPLNYFQPRLTIRTYLP